MPETKVFSGKTYQHYTAEGFSFNPMTASVIASNLRRQGNKVRTLCGGYGKKECKIFHRKK